MMTTSNPPTNRAQRRSRRVARATDESQNEQGEQSAYDVDAMSRTVGARVTERDIDAAYKALDMVNLDELVAPTVRVAIMERTAHDITLADGTTAQRYTFAPRIAEITLFPSVETQLKAFALNRTRRASTIEEQVPAMLDLLLDVWRMSEPDMTLERLRAGLDVFRISKLFQLCFTPPRRP